MNKKSFGELLPGDKIYEIIKDNVTTVIKVKVISKIIINKKEKEISYLFTTGNGFAISISDINGNLCISKNIEHHINLSVFNYL